VNREVYKEGYIQVTTTSMQGEASHQTDLNIDGFDGSLSVPLTTTE
jgi:hypothetical protein